MKDQIKMRVRQLLATHGYWPDASLGNNLRALYGHLFVKLLGVRWIVAESEGVGELGIRVAGQNLWYYKWPDPMIDPTREYREARKREFGEVIRSQSEE